MKAIVEQGNLFIYDKHEIEKGIKEHQAMIKENQELRERVKELESSLSKRQMLYHEREKECLNLMEELDQRKE